ncbi:hypothetical protein H5410_039368 [Solanum commersonii]|uniref:Defective in cullin neddylation protein n=1 Tax=Solanum commersonii TaxID=4109 RepID=A0A9J5YEU1_SOLCO|nr:hypothetical protein H5410_039368 [Solanum commersonii]
MKKCHCGRLSDSVKFLQRHLKKNDRLYANASNLSDSNYYQNKLGIGRRDKVQQFMTITGASEKVALQALKVSDWNLEGAFDVFYSQSQVKSSADTRRPVC